MVQLFYIQLEQKVLYWIHGTLIACVTQTTKAAWSRRVD